MRVYMCVIYRQPEGLRGMRTNPGGFSLREQREGERVPLFYTSAFQVQQLPFYCQVLYITRTCYILSVKENGSGGRGEKKK